MASGEDKHSKNFEKEAQTSPSEKADFEKEFQREYNHLKKQERKYKNKNPEVSCAYAEEAEEMKQRYERKSPKLMKQLGDYCAMEKLRKAVFAMYPYHNPKEPK